MFFLNGLGLVSHKTIISLRDWYVKNIFLQPFDRATKYSLGAPEVPNGLGCRPEPQAQTNARYFELHQAGSDAANSGRFHNQCGN